MAKGHTDKSESSPRSPQVGPCSGAQRTATPPGLARNADECRYMRMAPPSPAEILLMPTETNTSYTDMTLRKNLAGAPTLLQGCRGYTRGCASAPPRNSIATEREESPISKRQPLRVPNGYHCRGSGATVGDNHKGLLITRENPLFRKIIKRKTNMPRTPKAPSE
jgi:hypothetical protein